MSTPKYTFCVLNIVRYANRLECVRQTMFIEGLRDYR